MKGGFHLGEKIKGGMLEGVVGDIHVMECRIGVNIVVEVHIFVAMAEFQSKIGAYHHLTWMGNCQKI